MSESRLGKLIGKAVHVEHEPLERVNQRGVETARRLEAGIRDIFDAYNRGEIEWPQVGERSSLITTHLDRPPRIRRNLVVCGLSLPLPSRKLART